MSLKYQMDVVNDGGMEKSRVRFSGPMDGPEWEILRKQILEMIDEGYRKWVFDLTGNGYCDSKTLGFWVTMNATIQNRAGELEFILPMESDVRKVLSITALDKIFTLKTEF